MLPPAITAIAAVAAIAIVVATIITVVVTVIVISGSAVAGGVAAATPVAVVSIVTTGAVRPSVVTTRYACIDAHLYRRTGNAPIAPTTATLHIAIAALPAAIVVTPTRLRLGCFRDQQ